MKIVRSTRVAAVACVGVGLMAASPIAEGRFFRFVEAFNIVTPISGSTHSVGSPISVTGYAHAEAYWNSPWEGKAYNGPVDAGKIPVSETAGVIGPGDEGPWAGTFAVPNPNGYGTPPGWPNQGSGAPNDPDVGIWCYPVSSGGPLLNVGDTVGVNITTRTQ